MMQLKSTTSRRKTPVQQTLPSIAPSDLATAQLAGNIREKGSYTHVRALEDGTIIGLGPLLFTTALYVDLSLNGWTRRYCYDSTKSAAYAFDSLQSADCVPVGWIAQRGSA